MIEKEIIGSASFRFSSRFGQLIGRNLISNPIVAVAELVKNSYDADADNISVIFSGLKNNHSTLIISDDGIGMSYTDIVDKWLMVGTDNKIKDKCTPKGRRKLGEKGIGRFSVERLAKNVVIITSQGNQNYALQFSIDWDKYENMQGEFSDIKYDIEKIPYSNKKNGTTLIMTGLRDNWDTELLIKLKRELYLIRPININDVAYKRYTLEESKVNIQFQASDYNINYRSLSLGFMKYYQAHLFGEVYMDKTAIVKVQIKSNISINGQPVDKEFRYTDADIDISCGPLTFEAFVFFRDQRLYKSLDIDKHNFTDLLDSYCGVKLYRDGFRILPFGDPDNDWLGLNAARTASPEHRISTSNVIGIVNITRDKNIGLEDVLSRENMYLTPQFISMKKFVSEAFEKYTSIQMTARKSVDKTKQEQGKAALVNVQKAVSIFGKDYSGLQEKVNEISSAKSNTDRVKAIAETTNSLVLMVQSAENALKSVKAAYSYYKMQDSFKSREMQIYRNIATLGISAAMFGHEAQNQAVDAKALCKIIKHTYHDIFKSTKNLEEDIDTLQKKVILIDEKADFFRNYLRRDKQDRAQNINLYEVLSNIVSQHSRAFESINANILVKPISSINNFITWGYRGDFDSIFTNLITNAYKALKGMHDDKYLHFILDSNGEYIIINEKNSGVPISQSNRQRIFEPLFSTYSDGTGLGLTIIQDTLIGYNGKIELLPQYPETNFKITILRNEKLKED